MPIDTRTATAAIALLVGAGAYPFAATAQTDTQNEEVEVEVIEAEEAGENVEQGAEEAGETVVQGAEEAGEAIGEAAETTGQALEEGAQETGQAIGQATEEIGQDADIDTTAAEDLDESQKRELEQAAAEGKPVPRPEMIMGVQQDGQWLSSELIGREVRNQNGDDIGDIGAILFSDQGPDGVIVEVGGFLGMGEKDVAIRWNELAMSEQGIMLDTSKEALENAPEFLTLEEQRREAELQAQQEAAEAEQAAQQATGTTGGTMGEQPAAGGTMTEQPAEGGTAQ